MTFAGIKMPDRKRLIKSGKVLRDILKDKKYDEYTNLTSLKTLLDSTTLQVVVDTLGEELIGTGYLSKYVTSSLLVMHY